MNQILNTDEAWRVRLPPACYHQWCMTGFKNSTSGTFCFSTDIIITPFSGICEPTSRRSLFPHEEGDPLSLFSLIYSSAIWPTSTSAELQTVITLCPLLTFLLKLEVAPKSMWLRQHNVRDQGWTIIAQWISIQGEVPLSWTTQGSLSIHSLAAMPLRP